MDDKILLLLMVLLSSANGQTTTTVSTSLQSIGEKELSSKTDDGKDLSADASALNDSNSALQFSVVATGDNKSNKENPDNAIADSGEDSAELSLIESLIDDSDKIIGGIVSVANTNAHGDDTGVKYFHDNDEDPMFASNTDEVEVRTQAGENSELRQPSTPAIDFDEVSENRNAASPSVPLYESANDQLYRRDPNADSSPLLQLTQGGYQRPYQPTNRFIDRQQGLRSESATEQADTVESPNADSNNRERTGRILIPPRVPYSVFQPPFGFEPGPLFRQPFGYQAGGLGNSNNIPNDAQNPFFSNPVTVPADFAQGQYSQVDNNGNFPGVGRDSISMFQTAPRAVLPHSGYLFQNPLQLPGSQPSPVHPPRPSYFQTGNAPGHYNFDSTDDSTADFTALFGGVAPMNSQFQENPNLYRARPNFGGHIFSNPAINFMQNYQNPGDRTQYPSRFMNFPSPNGGIPLPNRNRQQQDSNTSLKQESPKQDEQINMLPNKDDPRSVPFGTRIQRQNDAVNRDDLERQDNVYMRYPMAEAGYATEETLPTQNDTNKRAKDNDSSTRQRFPFFSIPRRYNVFDGPDPYKVALVNAQSGYPNGGGRNIDNKNGTNESEDEQRVPLVPDQRPDTPTQIFTSYPDRNSDLPVPNTPFYQVQGVNRDRNPFDKLSIFPENTYQFSPRPTGSDLNRIPSCAQKANMSLCFEDPDYPRGDLLYALNSDSFLLDRLVMPDQQLEGIPFVEQNTTESPQNEDNYICKSDIKYGLPLRAKNIQGNWKVVVNMERAIGRGKYVQPVRLEVCRGAGKPCSFTQIKTNCVQKYSLQRLLSWSVEKGVHNDVYKLPVACSCQIVEPKA